MQLLSEAVGSHYSMTEFPYADGQAGNAAAMARYPPVASVRIQVLIVFIMKLILRGERPVLFKLLATLLNPDRHRGETSSSEFFRRLDAIESFLWSQPRLPQTPQTGETRSGGFTFPSSSEHERADFSHPSAMLISSPSRPNPADISQLISTNSSSFMPPEHDIPPMSIPIGHTTTTEYMLHMNRVKTLFGEFPPDLFIRAESKRHLPHQLSFVPGTITASQLPILDEASTYPLVEAYFKHVHVDMPILDKDQFLGLYNHHTRAGLGVDCDSALCLAVLALGFAALEQVDPIKSISPYWVPGADFISPALQILMNEYLLSFCPTITLPQSLILISKYFGFLLRPLQSWKLIHMASTSIQYLNSRDLIAEHHLPRSGIEHVIDLTPFPTFANHDAQETHVFLAELSVRRLLNRVHHTMYGSDCTRRSLGLQPASSDSPSYDFQSLSTILSVSQELDRQLDNWFNLLPGTIKPDINDPSRCTGLQLNMLHRFHSAKDIITRPFLLCAIDSSPENDLPPMVLKQCESSIANCRAYLDASARRLMGPSSCAEIIIHTMFSSILLMTLGSVCPALAQLVLDIDILQKNTIESIERFAVDGSLIQEIHGIIMLLHSKTRVLRRSM
ncbi:Transcription factor, fungi [Penicillium camemberti]|uniref:Transcription factor, fungi n=1 Tax=Penicillium camemberti (strain FM 013) TaxID=1429867 RepID=A0A0G4P4Q6_PENC3|nr:Transcription factor, fungi [Penicillium camemberti]